MAYDRRGFGETTAAGPSIDTKQVTTEVLVENGGTVGIGGIYARDALGLPFLGSSMPRGLVLGISSLDDDLESVFGYLVS